MSSQIAGRVKPATADAYRWPYTTATVVTSASAQVPVVKANVFVGKVGTGAGAEIYSGPLGYQQQLPWL